jgi:hypothetical protein
LTRLGGRQLLFEEGEIEFVVRKVFFPAIYLTVKFHKTYIEVVRETVMNRNVESGKKDREQLEVGLDEQGNMFFHNQKGDTFGVADTAQLLLRPLLQTRSVQ